MVSPCNLRTFFSSSLSNHPTFIMWRISVSYLTWARLEFFQRNEYASRKETNFRVLNFYSSDNSRKAHDSRLSLREGFKDFYCAIICSTTPKKKTHLFFPVQNDLSCSDFISTIPRYYNHIKWAFRKDFFIFSSCTHMRAK